MHDNLDELRHIEGFPIGEDEDLHALSDPPHYTAYPNPHIAEFIEKWGKPYEEETDDYHREPFVADVSEGKSDAIYRAHSYHTKVPYKAITRFIDHYTKPGDVVFDGFCGTGMTGIAAQMLGRRAILVDLSPAATFIAYNYNMPVDVDAFERGAKRILAEVEAECGWMYETCHTDGRVGRINYTVWSDVFVCPYCSEEVVFWEAAVNSEAGKVRKAFPCPGCGAEMTKRDLARATERVHDSALGQEIERARQVPVLINYSVDRKHYEKKPDADDLALIRKIEKREIPYWYPTNPMMGKGDQWGDTWRAGIHYGITHVHHFYTRRALWTLGTVFHRLSLAQPEVRFWLIFTFEQAILGMSRLARYVPTHYSQVNQYLSGTLYIGSQVVDVSLSYILAGKISRLQRVLRTLKDVDKLHVTVSTQSVTDFKNLPHQSVDYIFTDPPFGDNLMYSELNFLWEAWLRVFTNTGPEAIINKTQGKALAEYRELMTRCFSEMYRVLKPSHWITVVFHNSKASVGNAIQEALAKAGFLVAQVTIMDKQQGTFKQVTAPGAVKNDLIINAYKPCKSFEERFLQQTGYGLEQEFVAQHLGMLPVEPNLERTAQMLYSRMLAYYVQHGYEITLNADQFYSLLADHFLEQDGYWFRDEEQVQEYERRKLKARIKTLIGDDELEKALDLFKEIDQNSAILYQQRLSFTKRAQRQGTIERDQVYVERNKLTVNLLQELEYLDKALEQGISPGESWHEWQQAIMDGLLTRGEVRASELSDIPAEFGPYAINRFVDENAQMRLSYEEGKAMVALIRPEQVLSLLNRWGTINASLSRPRKASGTRRLLRISADESTEAVDSVIEISTALSDLLGISINGDATMEGKFVSGFLLD